MSAIDPESGSEAEPYARPRFPVVAVGASAEGLETTAELLRELGERPGLAVVLILQRAHAGDLIERFRNSTALAVQPARAGLRIQVDCVYVASDGAAWRSERGVLQRGNAADGSQLPIDNFMEALAHERQRDAVAVLLRGTGADGARGMRAIARSGGTTFTEHEGRPAAIAQRLRELGERARGPWSGSGQPERGFVEMLLNAAQAIAISNSQGAIVFANHMASDTFGYSRDVLLTLSCEQLLPERGRAEHRTQRANFLRFPEQRGSNRDLVTFGLRKDGSEFPMVVNFGAMFDAGKPFVVSFITDVTLQHVAERQIRQYEARLKRMAFEAAVTEERERRRIAADLHDGVGQSLALAQIKLSVLRASAPEHMQAGFDEIIELLATSVLDTRSLTTELSPPMLYDLGIKDALSWLAEDIEKRQGVHVELSDDDSAKPLDESTAALVYRAVRELLMNVFKHAKCTSANIVLRRDQDDIEIDVVDLGVGFTVAEAVSQVHPGGFGLFNVREQITRLGGTMSVVSKPGQGTRVSLRVPMRQPS